MNNIVALALLAGGVLLIVIGINATNAFSADATRFLTGSPTDKGIWMLIGGILVAVAGVRETLRSSRAG